MASLCLSLYSTTQSHGPEVQNVPGSSQNHGCVRCWPPKEGLRVAAQGFYAFCPPTKCSKILRNCLLVEDALMNSKDHRYHHDHHPLQYHHYQSSS